MPTQAEKGAAFAALHAGEPFLIPNPWDVGSARVLEGLGFPALATTSSGFAPTLGRRDGGATLDEVAAHVHAVSSATTVPLSVDLENGLGDPGEAIRRVAAAGAVGASIEDWDPSGRLYELDEAVERVAAAAEVAQGLGFPFVLTGRAENHLRGNPDLADTIARLRAYAEAGADCLYAPGLQTADEIRAVCDAVDRPVNVLAMPKLTVADIFAAGAQRISVGGRFAWIAMNAAAAAAEQMRDEGTFATPEGSRPFGDWLA